MTHIASRTNLTNCGGFFIALTIEISAGLIVSKAVKAASNAGVASARSLSQSSFKKDQVKKINFESSITKLIVNVPSFRYFMRLIFKIL